MQYESGVEGLKLGVGTAVGFVGVNVGSAVGLVGA